MSALPEHVSGVTPIKGHLDGTSTLAQAFANSEEEIGYLEAHDLPDPDVGGERAQAGIYLLPEVPPKPVRETYWKNRRRTPKAPVLVAVPEPRRRRATKVLVRKAEPSCWALAMELGWALERITIEADGSVIHHNSHEQAQAWRRRNP